MPIEKNKMAAAFKHSQHWTLREIDKSKLFFSCTTVLFGLSFGIKDHLFKRNNFMPMKKKDGHQGKKLYYIEILNKLLTPKQYEFLQG